MDSAKIISKQMKIIGSIIEKDHNSMKKDSNYTVINLYILIRGYLESKYSEKSTKISHFALMLICNVSNIKIGQYYKT